jgi:hypothetical protein
MEFKTTFFRYTDLVIVIAAIMNVVKFALMRDAAALKTIAGVAGLSFTAFALYLNFVAPVVARAVIKK